MPTIDPSEPRCDIEGMINLGIQVRVDMGELASWVPARRDSFLSAIGRMIDAWNRVETAIKGGDPHAND